MTTGCTTAAAITNGGQVSGLTQGTTYFATVTASASPGYLVSAASSASAGLAATTQLSAPTSVTLGHGTLAGSLTVSFTAPANAVVGQTYTTVLCTNSGMTTGCTDGGGDHQWWSGQRAHPRHHLLRHRHRVSFAGLPRVSGLKRFGRPRCHHPTLGTDQRHIGSRHPGRVR